MADDQDQPDVQVPASCERWRRQVLDRPWHGEDLAEARALLAHVDRCGACRAALNDYDALRQVLGGDRSETANDVSRAQDHDVEPAGGWPVFERRLSDTRSAAFAGTMPAGAEQPGDQGQRAQSTARPMWHSPWLLAASILLMACGWGLYAMHWVTGTGDQDGGHIDSPVVQDMSEYDIARNMELFESVSRVFDGRASWVALTDHDSEVGLSASVPTSDRLLMLRLTLARDGRATATADLAIVPGQSAQWSLPAHDGERVRFRIHADAHRPAMLSILAEIEPGNGEPGEQHVQEAALTALLRTEPEQVLAAGELKTKGGRYELTVRFAEVSRPDGTATRELRS